MRHTLMFVALAALTATASAATLPQMLAGQDWAALQQPPARLQQQFAQDHNLDCRMERYSGGRTLDCVLHRPLQALGVPVEEFYVLHNRNGERMLKFASPAGVEAVRQAAQVHFPKAHFMAIGPRRWKADLGAGRAIVVSQRNDLAGELAYVHWSGVTPGARAAGATAQSGVLEGRIAMPIKSALRVCAVNAGIGPGRCVALAADAHAYRIEGLQPGRYFAIGYAEASRWNPAHAQQWSNCKPSAQNDCTNGILKAVFVSAGNISHAALNHDFTALPAALQTPPQAG